MKVGELKDILDGVNNDTEIIFEVRENNKEFSARISYDINKVEVRSTKTKTRTPSVTLVSIG